MLRPAAAVPRSLATGSCHTTATEGLMRFRLAAAIAFVLLVICPSRGSAQVLTEHDVSVRMALSIAEEALAQCGVKTSVAIVDRAGRLRLFLQGDGAQPHNLELARRKAYTALTFQRTSAEWA